MATNETKLPAIPPIPSNTDPQLKTYLSAVDEALKVRLGTLGDPKDRAITVRELIDSGLAENFKENPFDPNAGTPENTFIPTERVDVTIPPDVTGFSGAGAFQKIILSWDLAQFGNFAFTEVWRHTSNNIGSATRIDTTRASVYADTVDLAANFYYWVRHVSTSNVVGQFTSGINVTTSKVSSSNVTDFFVADSITAASGVIADAAIGTAQIDDAAITTAKINNAAITNAKILSLNGDKIDINTLNADRIEANTVNGVQKGTAHTFSTIKVTGSSYAGGLGNRAIVSDILADGSIQSSVGGTGGNGSYGYNNVIYPHNTGAGSTFGTTFGLVTPYWTYRKGYGGVVYEIHLKRIASVPFVVTSTTQGNYFGIAHTQFYGAYTGDEINYMCIAFGTSGFTPQTYVANETNGSGATGTPDTTQGNKGQAWVDTGTLGTGGFNHHVVLTSNYLSAGDYYFNVWGATAMHNTGSGHFYGMSSFGVYRQHI